MVLPLDDDVEPGFTERAFRDRLGLFPTGIGVVTATTKSGERLGLTVSSFSSVSLSPPLVLFSLTRTARSFAQWRRVRAFAINVLDHNQHALSNRFARAGSDKWAGLHTMYGEAGAPLLMDALAIFECKVHRRHDGGDHEIVVGRVIGISAQGSPRGPLVFFRGRYHRLDPAANIETPADDLPLLRGGAWLL